MDLPNPVQPFRARSLQPFRARGPFGSGSAHPKSKRFWRFPLFSIPIFPVFSKVSLPRYFQNFPTFPRRVQIEWFGLIPRPHLIFCSLLISLRTLEGGSEIHHHQATKRISREEASKRQSVRSLICIRRPYLMGHRVNFSPRFPICIRLPSALRTSASVRG